MDEHTLNDLLECSVCLDRLDTSSKVLPCQHTFCRKCLEVIVSSHNELRCPECRILVDIKIDNLPPNVLLMRILGGMKHTAAGKNQQTDNKLDEQEKNQQETNQHQQVSHSNAPQNIQQQQPTRRCILPHAYALYDFATAESTDLNFKKGDLILLKRRIDSNWFVGQSNGKEGTFPVNYVQVMVALPAPQCVALYDFKMGPNEEEGCLNFKKGTVIHVLRRVDHNWAEGRIGTDIGIFPIAFVELNVLAKQLLDSYVVTSSKLQQQQPQPRQQQQVQQQPHQLPHQQQQKPQQAPVITNHINVNTQDQLQTQVHERHQQTVSLIDPTEPTTSSSTSTSNTASPNSNSAASNSSSSSSNCSPHHTVSNTPQHRLNMGTSSVRYREKGAKEKRHSLNALLTSSGQPAALSLIQTNRHSAEILSLTHDLNGATTNSNFRSSVEANESPQNSNAEKNDVTMGTTVGSGCGNVNSSQRVNVLKTGGQQSVPPSLPWGYLALYPYKPCKSDELELKKGCVYIVTERCLDGWFKGKNWQDISGVFPGNYVTPLRTRDQQQLMHQWKYVPQVNQNANSGNNLPVLSCPAEQATNMKISNLLPHQPPDLPPRQQLGSTITQPTPNAATCSVWTKPLGQTVESFFNRNKSTVTTTSASNAQPIDTKEQTNNSSTASSGAVSLMKRLTYIKSRSKSPGAQLHQQQQQLRSQTLTNDCEVAPNEGNVSRQLHPVHVRSGSCPSQLLQSLPIESTQQNHRAESIQHAQQKHSQPITSTAVGYGSQRLKANKERPHLVCARQSLDPATFRSIYNITSPTPSTNYATVHPQQPTGQSQFMTSQLHANMIIAPNHRKSHSLDAGNILTAAGGDNSLIHANQVDTAISPLPSNITEAAIKASATTKSAQCTRESRFRCVVPYPPNSDIELELHVGDIIYVQGKQKNGWYKGTHARTNKTGLFPASFVEPDI